jgi:TonB-dependent SusC/RagA subfamily outer membrane receptor
VSLPATYDTLQWLPPMRLDSGDTVTLVLPFNPRRTRPGPEALGPVFSQGLPPPLWLIDGVPSRRAPGATGWSPPDLSDTRVARIEVLRGAAAASLYGSRASGGVILVTTRRP